MGNNLSKCLDQLTTPAGNAIECEYACAFCAAPNTPPFILHLSSQPDIGGTAGSHWGGACWKCQPGLIGSLPLPA